MRIMKLLALATVAVVAVACNGISPSSPNSATVASEDAAGLVGAQAVKDAADGSPCRDVTEVKLALLRSPSPGFDTIDAFYLKVEAVYLYHGAPLPSTCQVAPKWSSRPRGRLIPTKDPFIVKVTRTRPPTTVHVRAEAPNGVQGDIRVQ